MLYVAAAYAASWSQTFLLYHTVPCALVVVGKMPFMHGVRVFGMNKSRNLEYDRNSKFKSR